MRVIFFLLFFVISMTGMTGKQIKKEVLPYVTLNAQDAVSVLRFTKNTSPKIVVGTKSVNSQYINSLMYIFNAEGTLAGVITNPDAVNCLDTSPTNDRECVSDCGKSAKTWDVEKMRLKSDFSVADDNFPIVTLEYNKSGDKILCAADTMAKVYDLNSGDVTHEFNAHAGGIQGACWSPDDYHIATVGADNTIKLWDMRRSGLIKQEKRPSKSPVIAYNSNNDLIAADLYLYVYEPGLAFSHAYNFDGKDAPIKGSRIGLENNNSMPKARSLAFIPGLPEYIIAGIDDGSICLCNQSEPEQSRTIKAVAKNLVEASETGKALGVSPDGKILAVGSFLEQSVRLWGLEQLISSNGSTRSITSFNTPIFETEGPKQSSACCTIS